MEDNYWPDDVPIETAASKRAKNSYHNPHVHLGSRAVDITVPAKSMDAIQRMGEIARSMRGVRVNPVFPTLGDEWKDVGYTSEGGAVYAAPINEEGKNDVKLSEALEAQLDDLAKRIAETKAHEEALRQASEREPARPTDPDDCPVIYWTRELQIANPRTVRTWVKITDGDGNERNVQELVDKPAEFKIYTYLAFRSTNGLWYSTSLGERYKSGVTWATLMENTPEIVGGKFWIATGWTRPEGISE